MSTKKQSHIIYYCLGILFIFIGTTLKAEHFEGFIKFHQYKANDTLILTYSIKGQKIRINKHDKDGITIQCLLVNIEKDKVTALHPQRNLYRPLNLNHKKEQRAEEKEDYKIIRHGNYKNINGVKCYQWRVRNRKNNSEIAYWVTKNNFDFFTEVFDLLKSTNRIYHFFTEIPGNEGFFPMLSVERTLLRNERQRIAVVKIKQKPMHDQLFHIPDNYRMIKH